MPSGWDVYYVVFLSALLALAIPVALRLISLVVTSRQGPTKETTKPDTTSVEVRKNEETKLGRRIHTRFFLGANVALILTTLALVLIPCVTALPGEPSSHSRLALLGVFTIIAFCALGLLYAARKGDLDWMKTFVAAEPGEKENKARATRGAAR